MPVGFRRLVRLQPPGAGRSSWRSGSAVATAGATGRKRRALASLPPAPPGAPNVLLIVLDTVRADHLSLYGYGRDTTPNLVPLAARGVPVRARPRDGPLDAAVARQPVHRPLAARAVGRPPTGRSTRRTRRWPSSSAPRLRHRPGSSPTRIYLQRRYGLDRGFVHYEDYDENRVVSPGEILRSSALGRRARPSSLGARGQRPARRRQPPQGRGADQRATSWTGSPAHAGRPFFAFLNYFDAHDPYLLPAGFDRHFGLRPETPPCRTSTLHQLSGEATPDRPPSIPRRGTELARDAYDDCLAYLDEQLGRLLDELERRGVLANTLVIVTSDHGEHLGEHQLFGHGRSLYRPVVHVPLVIVAPSGVPAGRSVREPVSLRDLPATVADLLGLGAPSPFPGRSLARLWEAGPARSPAAEARSSPRSTAPAEGPRQPLARPRPAGPMKSLVAEEKVYIRNGDGREELYDLDTDPRKATTSPPLPTPTRPCVASGPPSSASSRGMSLPPGPDRA